VCLALFRVEAAEDDEAGRKPSSPMKAFIAAVPSLDITTKALKDVFVFLADPWDKEEGPSGGFRSGSRYR
jgi:hypothetical protein